MNLNFKRLAASPVGEVCKPNGEIGDRQPLTLDMTPPEA